MKFNSKSKGKNITTNFEGSKTYRLLPDWELYVATVTSALNDKFYEGTSTRLERIKELILRNEPEFVAQLAIYTREKMNLRSIPLVLAVELAKIHRGDSIVSRMVAQIIQRADEITELLAYYQLANQRLQTKKLNKLSKQIRLGLQESFNKFDEYQFAKYNRNAEIKLRDALFLVHPKAKNEVQQMLFNKIVNDELETPYTWETELSALGQQKFLDEEQRCKAFCTKWEELIDSGKVGYMALLRNLRNILESKVSREHIDRICDKLTDKDTVLRSKQLPFRYLAAYRELAKVNSIHAGSIMNTLEKAVTIAAENITGIDWNTSVLLACDVSGSMQKPVSPKSKILAYDIGLMLAMILKSRCKNAITGMFGDKWKIINVPSSGILSNVDAFYKREGEVGYSTNGYLVIEDLIKNNLLIDKVMIFTDCQLWNNRSNSKINDLWNEYKNISPTSKLYLFDLAGYGNTPLEILQNDVYLLGGWSDRVFEILASIDRGETAMTEIRKIVF